jgi:hypothetical protein
MEVIRRAIYEALNEDHPMTVRQLFYRLVSQAVIAKTEAEYKQTVVRLLSLMRREGVVPFGWVADSTRWMRKPKTFTGLEDMLEESQRTYRRDIWEDQDAYVEIWLEKDALAGVLYPITQRYHVPLMVTRGYPSLSYLYEAADAIQDQGKPAYLYYFGDYDPSGLDITRVVEKGIREFAPEAEIHFERLAVTERQIRLYDLPTRPTKTTDSRSKGFVGESVEVDAIPPATLREMVEECIVEHLDVRQLEATKETERLERETLLSIINDRRAS